VTDQPVVSTAPVPPRSVRPGLPSGVVTLLFTDIEGSTRLLARLGDAYGAVLELHDQLLRDVVTANGGRVVNTQGDSFFVVFEQPSSAVDAALEAQRRIASAGWPAGFEVRVRMGIHTGTVALRASDYVGIDVHRAARIMGAGHGGQVLISAPTAAGVDGALPAGATLRDLGAHLLKDLAEPIGLFQLVHPDLATDFPALVTADAGRRGLPVPASPFVGRERELATLAGLLTDQDDRLITLIGPGGSGKTRLALRAAADLQASLRDGALFVDLAPVTDVEAALALIATAIGAPQSREQPVLEEIKLRLRDQETLLLLDNLEQVPALGPSIADLLAVAPRLRVLATSREPLHVRGEQRFPVPPLALPDAERLPETQELDRFEAIRLFVERARAVRPDFALTDDNAAAVVEICRRLDGLPLAIELATARLTLFEPDALRDRLGSRLQGAGRGTRDLPERQQTLRSTIDWSYRLLEAPEQQLFEVLSLVSHLSFEAVEGIAGALDLGVDPLDGLASLIDQSLVRRDGATGLGLLQTIREFAAERLAARPELAAAAREAHARWFTDEARHHLADSHVAGARIADDLAPQTEDLEAAWRSWLEGDRFEELEPVFKALAIVHEARARYRAIVDLAEAYLAALARTPASEARAAKELTLRTARARALLALEGYTEGVEQAYEEALGPLRAEGARPRSFPVLRDLSRLYLGSGRFLKAEVIGRELLSLADDQDDPAIRLDARLLIANARMWEGDLHEAVDILETSIATFDGVAGAGRAFRIGPDPRISTLTTSAFIRWMLGYPDTAAERMDQAVQLARESGPYSLVYALYHAGFLRLWRAEPELVAARTAELLDVLADRDFPIWRALGTCLAGVADSLLGRGEDGLRRFDQGLAMYRGMKTPPAFWPGLRLLRTMCLVSAGRLQEAAALTAEVQREPSDAASHVLALVLGADVAAATGDVAGAAAQLEDALERATSMDARMFIVTAETRRLALHRGADVPDDGSALRAAYEALPEGHASRDGLAARALLEA